MESSHACTGSSTPRGPRTARDSAASGVAFRRFRARRHPGQAQFRGSIAGLRAPLSTLRCALTGRQHMTQGHRDSLDLRCRTLSFPSLMPVVRRFPENGASRRRPTKQQVRPAVQRILDAMTQAPAFIRNGRRGSPRRQPTRLRPLLRLPRPRPPCEHSPVVFLDPRSDASTTTGTTSPKRSSRSSDPRPAATHTTASSRT